MRAGRTCSGAALFALLSIACGSDDGSRDASSDARVLDCDGPIEFELTPATTGPNTGLPMAAITWSGDHCVLVADERHPDAVLVIADTTGTFFDSGVVAARAGDWIIERWSRSESRTTYVAAVPRNTDVFVELESEDGRSRVRIDFRVGATTLTLLAMREL